MAELKGVYRAREFADAIERDFTEGIEAGTSTGWPSLDYNYLVKRGQWTVLTGIPNHGKSTWLDNLMVNMARASGWKFLICSPENQPIERHVESLMEIYTGKRFGRPSTFEPADRFMTVDELAEAMAFVDKHFKFIFPEETDFNIDFITALAAEVHEEGFEFDGFVIDPYNELEHKRPASMTETEYISSLLSKFRRFCRSWKVHGWMVAHPTKLRELQSVPTSEDDPRRLKVYSMPSLYDIAGSANWRNKADMGVVIYRNIGGMPETTTVSIQKVRFRECGRLGQAEFFYDFVNNRFVERANEMWVNRLKGGADATD